MKYIREEGKIYFAESKTEECYNYIFKSNATDGYNAYTVLSSNNEGFSIIDSGPTFSWDLNWNIREATELEKQWLNECIKEKRFIPKEQIKEYKITENNYEIY